MPITTLTNPVFISTTKAGRVNSGGTIGVYLADGLFTTLATIYSDQVKTTELTNPVTLDDAGTKEIWYEVKVDIREKTKAGAIIRDTLNLDPNAGNAVVQGFNLAQNGSFEIDEDSDGQPDNWIISPYSGSAIAITSSIVTDGTKALEFNTGAAGSGGGTATSTKFPVTEGSVVSVSFSFYATNATTLNTFQIKWYDEANVLKSTSTVTMPASGLVPTSWTSYNEVITVDSAGTQSEIVLTGISSGGGNLSSKAYFDGIKITSREDDLVTLTKVQTITGVKTLTSPVINTQATGTAIKDEDDMVSDSAVHLATQQSIKAYVDTKIASLNTKIINIGDWNMDTTGNVSIAHGVTDSKIRTISVLIIDDLGAKYSDFSIGEIGGTTRRLIQVFSSNIDLFRDTGGQFDNSQYNATSFNRGWITIQYTD